MLIGSLRQTGVTICPVKEMINAKLDPALAVHAVKTTAAKTGGIHKQTDVPTSHATMVKINARET